MSRMVSTGPIAEQPAIAPRSRESLTVENRLAELARVERWLEGVLQRWTLSDRTVFAVDLLINEAVTNVINHAYSDTATHQITISLTDAATRIVVEIIDDGAAFDPLAAPPMEPGQDLAHASIGGRGIHLIKSYSAEHDYRRVAGRNHLTLAIPKVN